MSPQVTLRTGLRRGAAHGSTRDLPVVQAARKEVLLVLLRCTTEPGLLNKLRLIAGTQHCLTLNGGYLRST